MRPTIYYCYDAYCSWCYGFSPVIKKLWLDLNERFDFEVLSGGMILPHNPTPISVVSSYMLETCKKVEALTGIQFGEDFLWHIRNPADSDWFPDSLKPAIALCIFKEYHPADQVAFATDLQSALQMEGRDLCDDEAYRLLLLKYQLPEKEFYEKLHDEKYKVQAYSDFALVKHLKVTGYPCLFLQLSRSRFHMLANGYTDYAIVAQRINTIIAENNPETI